MEPGIVSSLQHCFALNRSEISENGFRDFPQTDRFCSLTIFGVTGGVCAGSRGGLSSGVSEVVVVRRGWTGPSTTEGCSW